MVAGAFPIVKLATLAFRQVSKPIAARLKERAKRSHFFRTYICMPPAQMYHWIEVNIKMRLLNLGKPSEVPKLNEAMAIELGAEMLGESIVFIMAAGTITFEYVRSSLKEKEREEAKEQQLQNMCNEIDELQFVTEKQDAEIRHMTRLVYSLEQKLTDLKNNSKKVGNVSTGTETKGPLETAILDAKISLGSDQNKK